jgi:hypothetical protein
LKKCRTTRRRKKRCRRHLVVAAGLSPPVEPVLEAVAPRLPEDVVPRRVPLHLPLDGLLHLRIQEAVEDGQKNALKNSVGESTYICNGELSFDFFKPDNFVLFVKTESFALE